jgi:hypothetical protein
LGDTVKKNELCWAFEMCGGTGEVNTEFRCGDVIERTHLGDLGVDGKGILKWIFKKWDCETETGFIWSRIGTSGGRFWTR